MRRLFKVILANVHTIFLIVGIAFIAVAAFLYSIITGWLVLGISFVAAGLLINKELGSEMILERG